jgi:hypothetical protein
MPDMRRLVPKSPATVPATSSTAALPGSQVGQNPRMRNYSRGDAGEGAAGVDDHSRIPHGRAGVMSNEVRNPFVVVNDRRYRALSRAWNPVRAMEGE